MIHSLHFVITVNSAGTLLIVALAATVSVKNGAPSRRI